MKIAITSDTHVHFLNNPLSATQDFMQKIERENVDAIVHLGDIGEGHQGHNEAYNVLLEKSFFVLGNHDLWRLSPMTPPESMKRALACLKGKPLEKRWEDSSTIYKIRDHVFVGTIGFPDFKHPALGSFPKDYWDLNPSTNDVRFIDLKRGWLSYTLPLQKAFLARLKRAVSTKAKHVIIVTHYPILGSQSVLSSERSEQAIWGFFFNWTLGRKVLAFAKKYPDKTFWCLAGHSHEYCSGKFCMELKNVYTYGFVTTYGTLRFQIIDTNLGFQEQKNRLDLSFPSQII